MKKCIYVNKEVEQIAKAKGIEINSKTINEALEVYLSSESFDCSELRKKPQYQLMTIRVHRLVIQLLQQLKINFRSTKVVNELVMGVILREFQNQTGRRKFPDRLYINLSNINDWLEKLSNRLGRLK